MKANYNCPNWLNESINRVSNGFNHHFQIRAFLMAEVTKEYSLSKELSELVKGCTNLIAVYYKKSKYRQDLLHNYMIDSRYFALPHTDVSTKLIYKMKLICNVKDFDQHSEQGLGLATGIISRLEREGFFEVQTISERFYKDMRLRSGGAEIYELVHLIALKGCGKAAK